jgi:CRP-like cAMP-binding protein
MDTELLLKAPLFKNLNADEITSLLATTSHRIKKYKADSFIARSGEVVDRIMVITSGIVKGEMVDYAGRVIKIEDIPAPGVLASAFIFGSSNRFPVNVVAVTDTEILMINKNDFLAMIIKSDRILINFLDMISNRSQFLTEKIKFLNFKTIKGKLANLLIQKAGPDKSVVRLGMTQNEIADFFGVARPSVARVLSELEDEGYLQIDKKEIKIIDKERLGTLSND